MTRHHSWFIVRLIIKGAEGRVNYVHLSFDLKYDICILCSTHTCIFISVSRHACTIKFCVHIRIAELYAYKIDPSKTFFSK